MPHGRLAETQHHSRHSQNRYSNVVDVVTPWSRKQILKMIHVDQTNYLDPWKGKWCLYSWPAPAPPLLPLGAATSVPNSLMEWTGTAKARLWDRLRLLSLSPYLHHSKTLGTLYPCSMHSGAWSKAKQWAREGLPNSSRKRRMRVPTHSQGPTMDIDKWVGWD